MTIALIPLSKNQYGTDDEMEGIRPCQINSPNSKEEFFIWFLCIVCAPAVVCILLMMVWIIEIRIKLHKQQKQKQQQQNNNNNTTGNNNNYHNNNTVRVVEEIDSSRFEREKALLNALVWYPICLSASWLPTLSYVACTIAGDGSCPDGNVYVQVVQMFQTQFGTCLAFIYFSHSPSARHVWKSMSRKHCSILMVLGCKIGILQDDDSSNFEYSEEDRSRSRETISSRSLLPEVVDDEDFLVAICARNSVLEDANRALGASIETRPDSFTELVIIGPR
jgi:hypothetical protein